MSTEVHVERMGAGHALTVSATYRLEPGELTALQADTDLRADFAKSIAHDVHGRVAKVLPDQLKKVKP